MFVDIVDAFIIITMGPKKLSANVSGEKKKMTLEMKHKIVEKHSQNMLVIL